MIFNQAIQFIEDRSHAVCRAVYVGFAEVLYNAGPLSPSFVGQYPASDATLRRRILGPIISIGLYATPCRPYVRMPQKKGGRVASPFPLLSPYRFIAHNVLMIPLGSLRLSRSQPCGRLEVCMVSCPTLELEARTQKFFRCCKFPKNSANAIRGNMEIVHFF